MPEQTLDLSPLRDQFPALQEIDEHGRPFVYLDGPGGTQVPRVVIEAMTNYLTRANANKSGQYTTSQRSDEIICQSRLAMADFLNAASPQEIAAYLGQRGIFVWDANYYALSVTERLGVEAVGGMVRVGLAHYNTRAEVDRLLAALRELPVK